MTKVINGVIFIEDTPEEECQMCGKIDELRPYGPYGKNICFECGMKDRETTLENMKSFFQTGKPATQTIH